MPPRARTTEDDTDGSDEDQQVVELNPNGGFTLDVDARPLDEIPPFPVHLVKDGDTVEFLLPEPDGQTSMDLEEAQVSRRFFQLAFGDQWPEARPLIESVKDRSKLVTLAVRYLNHFQLDSATIAEEQESFNRAQRRQRRRSSRR